jgi:APA family basic amino acid/polyamine antiporter
MAGPFYGNSNGVIAAPVTFANYAAIFFQIKRCLRLVLVLFFVPKVLAIFSIILLTYINTKGVESGKRFN